MYAPLTAAFAGMALLTVIPVVFMQPALGTLALALVALPLGLGFATGADSVQAVNAQGQSCRLLDKRYSPYGEVRILEHDDRYRYLVANGMDQGGIDIRTGESAYDYYDAMIGLADLYLEGMESALIIGLGPGVMAQALMERGVAVEVVEIDAEVARAARDYFGYRGSVVVDDGRRVRAERSGAERPVVGAEGRIRTAVADHGNDDVD